MRYKYMLLFYKIIINKLVYLNNKALNNLIKFIRENFSKND